MLSKFSVSNFKSFNSKFSLDFNQHNGYQFNSKSIKNEIINHSIIYGHNGAGKSNLGLAIFDIVHHLTDFEKNERFYSNYLNAYSKKERAEFEYEFKINGKVINYKYEKTDSITVVYEQLVIDNNIVAQIDRKKNNTAEINLKGTESLKKQISNENLSLLKYVKNNSLLEENSENLSFLNFFSFIEGMLFFRSLDVNMFIGLESGNRSIDEDIIERENVGKLENFLNDAKVEAKLTTIESSFNKKRLAFDFDGVKVPFYEAASTGTLALTLLYFWLQRLESDNKVSFMYIDEFDSFYHHNLAYTIVEKLKNTGIQFILTTHNTSIISNDLLRPDCYFFMTNKEIKSLANRTKKELREAHNIEKMYKAGSFNG